MQRARIFDSSVCRINVTCGTVQDTFLYSSTVTTLVLREIANFFESFFVVCKLSSCNYRKIVSFWAFASVTHRATVRQCDTPQQTAFHSFESFKLNLPQGQQAFNCLVLFQYRYPGPLVLCPYCTSLVTPATSGEVNRTVAALQGSQELMPIVLLSRTPR